MRDLRSTCWRVIRGAAAGQVRDREEFVQTYTPVIRAYLGARWRGSSLIAELDDAVQEVFVDCFKESGALGRVEPGPPCAFRAFLFGVVKNVARRIEHARATAGRPLPSAFEPPGKEKPPCLVLDQEWALMLVRQAIAHQTGLAREAGREAMRRVELLRLRFQDDLPIREIARLWDEDPDRLHRWYRKARQEFRASLHEVVRGHHAGTPGEIDRECTRLLALFA